jgi:putative PIN family toxin of toxin-antitoxin system
VERVTADSNIWISGLNRRGKPHELLNLARAHKIELAVSAAILDEFTRILRDKLQWSDERLKEMRAEVATFTKHIIPTESIDAVPGDPDDNRILECAVDPSSRSVRDRGVGGSNPLAPTTLSTHFRPGFRACLLYDVPGARLTVI